MIFPQVIGTAQIVEMSDVKPIVIEPIPSRIPEKRPIVISPTPRLPIAQMGLYQQPKKLFVANTPVQSPSNNTQMNGPIVISPAQSLRSLIQTYNHSVPSLSYQNQQLINVPTANQVSGISPQNGPVPVGHVIARDQQNQRVLIPRSMIQSIVRPHQVIKQEQDSSGQWQPVSPTSQEQPVSPGQDSQVLYRVGQELTP